eukprot:m.1347605 g.1347605  ORF g.1347605 m.1347605 type:complete len:764 (+) comp24912_c0_seq12:496-2787(+)
MIADPEVGCPSLYSTLPLMQSEWDSPGDTCQVEDICTEYLTAPVVGQIPGLWSDEQLRQSLAEQRARLARKSADVQKKKSSEAAQGDGAAPCGVKVSAISSIFTPFAAEARAYLAQRPWEAFLHSDSFTRYCQWKQLELNMCVTERDFDIHRILGRGGFGEVYGCRKRDTGKMFAMKQLDKKRLKEKGQEMTALHERNVLAEMNSKFVTNLKYAFQSNTTLFLILDLMEGGDLSFHLKRVGGRFTEDVAKFYAAEILLGLSHIHSRGMIYRDLKPANVLLDANGHARISDLGLVRDTQKTIPTSECGTHGYMAPEVLKPDAPYGLGADWFSLGCTVYELLVGVTPFYGSSTPGQRPRTQDVDRRTLMGVVQYPASLPAAAKDFLCATLKGNADERLGCVRGNLRASNPKAIQQHPWFADDIDWQALLDHKVVPKIKPLHGQVNAKEVHEIDRLPYTSKVKLTTEDNVRYRNFNHVMSHQWQEEVLPMFEMISAKADAYDRTTQRKITRGAQEPDVAPESVVLQGYMRKLTHGLLKQWSLCYVHLFRDRIESRREQRQHPRRIFPFCECALRVVEGREYDERTLILRLKDVDYCFKPVHVVDTTIWVRAVVASFEAASGSTADMSADDARKYRHGGRNSSEHAHASGSPSRSVSPRGRQSDGGEGGAEQPATPTHASASAAGADPTEPRTPERMSVAATGSWWCRCGGNTWMKMRGHDTHRQHTNGGCHGTQGHTPQHASRCTYRLRTCSATTHTTTTRRPVCG